MQDIHRADRGSDCHQRKRGHAEEIARKAQHLAIYLIPNLDGLIDNIND
jgi:hypothetical protein